MEHKSYISRPVSTTSSAKCRTDHHSTQEPHWSIHLQCWRQDEWIEAGIKLPTFQLVNNLLYPRSHRRTQTNTYSEWLQACFIFNTFKISFTIFHCIVVCTFVCRHYLDGSRILLVSKISVNFAQQQLFLLSSVAYWFHMCEGAPTLDELPECSSRTDQCSNKYGYFSLSYL